MGYAYAYLGEYKKSSTYHRKALEIDSNLFELDGNLGSKSRNHTEANKQQVDPLYWIDKEKTDFFELEHKSETQIHQLKNGTLSKLQIRQLLFNIVEIGD